MSSTNYPQAGSAHTSGFVVGVPTSNGATVDASQPQQNGSQSSNHAAGFSSSASVSPQPLASQSQKNGYGMTNNQHEPGKKSGLSVALQHERLELPSQPQQNYRGHSPSFSSAHHQTSPSPPPAMPGDSNYTTGTGSMLHSVSAYQHALLNAAASLASPSSSSASCIGNHVFAGRITGMIDVHAFHTCIQALVHRHAALRTNFQRVASIENGDQQQNGTTSPSPNEVASAACGLRFGQLIHPRETVTADFRHTTVTLDAIPSSSSYRPIDEITSLRSEHLPPQLSSLIDRASYESFNVYEDLSLFRVRLFHISPQSGSGVISDRVRRAKDDVTIFIFSLSALIGDIWSMTVLLDDFRVLYTGSLNMEHIDLTPQQPVAASSSSTYLLPETVTALDDVIESLLEPLIMDYTEYGEWQRMRLVDETNNLAATNMSASFTGSQANPSPRASPRTTSQPTLVTSASNVGSSAAATASASLAPTASEQGNKFWSFWSEHMSGTLPVLSLPNLVERPKVEKSASSSSSSASSATGSDERELPIFSSVPFTIPADLTRRLLSLATSERTELYTLLITAFQLFLFRLTGQDDVLLSSQASCRSNLETQNVIGPFSNTVLYRSNTQGNHIFRTYLQQVRQQIIGVRAHSEYPMTQLLERLCDAQQINSSTAVFPSLGSTNLYSASFDFEYPESSRFQDTLIYTVAAFASNVSGPGIHVGGIFIEPLEYQPSSSILTPFDSTPLCMKSSEVNNEIRGYLRYDTNIYCHDLITRMTHHWIELLSNIVQNPDGKISDLNLLHSAERNLLLHEWNETTTIHDKKEMTKYNTSNAKLVHTWFEARAAQTPQALAIESIDPHTGVVEKLTYSELNSRANQLGHYLRYLGIKEDEPIPLLLDRTPKFLISLLAILKAGACCMPIDPTIPDARIEYLLSQAKPVLIVTESKHCERVAKMFVGKKEKMKFNRVNKEVIEGVWKQYDEEESKQDDHPQDSHNSHHSPSSHSNNTYLLNLDTESTLIQTGNMHNLPVGSLLSSSTAYILYTSGSTGTPKGCMLTHANLINYLTWFLSTYSITPHDRVGHLANIAFDANIMETWPILCCGGCIVLGANEDIKLVPNKLVTWMQAHRVTYTFLTTQLCHQFLEVTYPPDFSLRYLFTGGDRLQRGTRAEDVSFQLVNVYGPTECTINVTVHTVPAGTSQPPPIGRPIANTQLYIVDAYMQPVPLGISGELMIGGLGVGKGYFNRPDLTAEKFVANPFYRVAQLKDSTETKDNSSSTSPSSTNSSSLHSHSPLLYRTGDLVRYRSNGLLEFVGRSDQQVKIRGYRIELAEIESAFLMHDMISEVCVVVYDEQKKGEKKLIAYLVTKEQKKNNNTSSSSTSTTAIPSLLSPPISYTDFKKYLRDKIPSYMIPSIILYLSYMPLTNNGKIHRQILPLPNWNDETVLKTLGQTSSDTYVPPTTVCEKIIVFLVRQLLNLGHKKISMSDDFFSLGGHSLSIGQLISKIDSRVGIELHYSKVFESPSLGALAKTLHGMLSTRLAQIELTPEEDEDSCSALVVPASSASDGLVSPPQLSTNCPSSIVRPSPSPLGTSPASSTSSSLTSITSSIPSTTSNGTTSTTTNGNSILNQNTSADFIAKRPPSLQPITRPIITTQPIQLNPASSSTYSQSAQQSHPLPKFQIHPNTPYRLSYNQSSLLFLSNLDPTGLSSLAYNIPFISRLYASTHNGVWMQRNEQALKYAFVEVVKRHSVLRTVFPQRTPSAATSATVVPTVKEDTSSSIISPYPASSTETPTPSARSNMTSPVPGRAPDDESYVVLTASEVAAGVPYQLVLPVDDARAQLDWEVVDGVSKHWTERDVKRYIQSETYRPFDLKEGPIMRVRVIRYAEASTGMNQPVPQRSRSKSSAIVPSSSSTSTTTTASPDNIHTILCWTVHHIAVDLWSMVVLIEEIKTLYAWYLSQANGSNVAADSATNTTTLIPCPHLTPSAELLQYLHCIPSQFSILSSAKAEKLWSYWLNQLAEPLPTLSIPTDKIRPVKQTYNGTSFTFPIPQKLHTSLTALAREEGVTMYTLLLASFYTLLHVYSGQDDLIVGSPLACRADGTRENVVGYFVNPLPLRSNLAGNPSFRSYVSRVKQVVLGALSHQDLPFPLLAQRVLQSKERDASRTPIWQSLFILQKPHKQILAEQGLAMFFMNAQGVEMSLGNQLKMESVQIGNVDDEKTVEDATPTSNGVNNQHHRTKTSTSSPSSSSHGGAGGQKHAQFDLALICGETHRDLVGSFHFNTDLFTLSSIERMAEHYVTLLESIVQNPQSKLSALNVLPQREKDVLLNEWCTTKPYDKDALIHQLVEKRTVEQPNALAICGPATSSDIASGAIHEMTYSQLNTRANQFSSYLRFAGVNLETPIFVLMNRTTLFITTLLACLKSGGSYIPIDPSYPKLRIEHIMEQAEAQKADDVASPVVEPLSPTSAASNDTVPPSSGPDGFALVLCERSLADKLPPLTGGKSRFKLLFLDELEAEITQYGNTQNLPVLAQQTALSCMSMVFTSGSTGKPKGVQVLHRGLNSYSSWWNAYLESGPHDRVSHLANVGFDASMTETWATLLAGASIFLCSDELTRLTPSLFVEWITRHRVTVAFLPTVLTEAFLDEVHPPNMSLRCLYTGGDKLHRGPRPGAKFRLICCYGPCESTIGVTATDVPIGMTAPPFNIGQPQANVQIFILDPNQKLLPIGTIGEMCIGGQQLARGYYNRPDLTRNAFIQNPFKKSITGNGTAVVSTNVNGQTVSAPSNDTSDSSCYSTSSVLYRTGDLARYLPDGSLEFWGRADFQVKIRGNRIELGEIEGAIREVEGVHDVVVVARSDVAGASKTAKKQEGEKKIIAYYVLKPNLPPSETVTSAILRNLLRERLPDFMLPSAFVCLPRLPLTPNGKVDRDALPAPDLSDLSTSRVHLAPRNEIEEQLAGIVQQVLGIPKVGMMDDFFTLGGHSLAAAQLLSRIRDAFCVDLPLSKIFDSSSFGAMAEQIEILRAAPSSEQRGVIIPNMPETPGSTVSSTITWSSVGGGSTSAVAGGGQRSALLAARMKAKPSATSTTTSNIASPSFLSSALAARSTTNSPTTARSDTRGIDTPTTGLGVSTTSTTRSPKSVSQQVGTPRLGSSPSKGNGLASFLAHRTASSSSRASGVTVGSLTGSGHMTPSALSGLAVPFAAPTLGFGGPSSSQPRSDDPSDDDEDQLYTRPSFLPGSTKRRSSLGAESVHSSQGSGSPASVSNLLGSSPSNPNRLIKRLAKLRTAESPTSSRRNSISRSRVDTPCGSDAGIMTIPNDAEGLAQQQTELASNEAYMTHSQSSLWFVNKLDAGGVTYTCIYAIELTQPYCPVTLEHAIYSLIIRHPSLRTVFIELNDEPVQRVLSPSDSRYDFQRRDILEGLGHDAEDRIRHADETEEQWNSRIRRAWKRLLMHENHIPFDISAGPVFRTRLFTVGSINPQTNELPPKSIDGISHGILHLMAHHIAVDGWSMELIMSELFAMYQEIYLQREAKKKEQNDDASSASGASSASNPSMIATQPSPSLIAELTSYLVALPPTLQTMLDRSLAERQFLSSPEGERCWNFWQRNLAQPLTLLELHTDFPRPPIQTYKGDVYHFSLPSELINGLRTLARREKATMFMTLFTSFAILLHRYTGQDDLCIGTPMASRNDSSYNRTVGHFVNPVVLRTNLAGNLSIQQLINNIKRITINSFLNDYPFSLLVDRLQSFRDSSRNPLFQVLFSLNQKFQAEVGAGSPTTDATPSSLSSKPLNDLDQLVSPFDLQLIMTEDATDLRADITYNTSLFKYETIRRMSHHLLELWSGMVQDVMQKISEVSILPEEERLLIVEGFNKPKHETKEYVMVGGEKLKDEAMINGSPASSSSMSLVASPSSSTTTTKYRNRFSSLSNQHCVHHLFELQTRLTPAAIAVVEYESFGKLGTKNNNAATAQPQARKPNRPAALFPQANSSSQQQPVNVTYAQLNARANSLAHYLREALNVRVGDVIVLLFYRCTDWLVALLAALKCGAAYVPVDAAYPSDRIRYMMSDAKAKVLLTHSRAYEVLSTIHSGIASIAAMDTTQRIAANFRGVFPPVLPETHTSVVMIDQQWSDISLFDTLNLDQVDVTLSHLCYLVYTSGSTGRPKGVMISHRSMYLIARWHALEYALTENDRVTQQTAPAFDPVGLELWSTWMSGASLHIVPDGVRNNPPALQSFMLRHQCTIAFMPTPICANMIDEPWPTSAADRAAIKLRVLSTGGDRLTRGPLGSNPLPLQTRFDNWYGPSECCLSSTPVITADGVKTTLGQLKAGDKLPTEDGLICNVTRNVLKSVPVVYEITDSHGASYTVTPDHDCLMVWSLQPTDERKKRKNRDDVITWKAEELYNKFHDPDCVATVRSLRTFSSVEGTPAATIMSVKRLAQGPYEIAQLTVDSKNHTYVLANGIITHNCTIISTYHHIPPGFDGPPPIGRVVDNTRIYIVDKHMHPVPIGVPGDIYVAGDNLATGYLNRDDLTKEKFRPDIFLCTKEELKEIEKKEREEEEEKKKADTATAAVTLAAASAPSATSTPIPTPQTTPSKQLSHSTSNGKLSSSSSSATPATNHRLSVSSSVASPPPSSGGRGSISQTPQQQKRGSVSSSSSQQQTHRSSVSSSPPAPRKVSRGSAPAPFIPAYPRMYESGDLGRWLPDGTIEFIGRRDFQVKIRGFRIELGEIESVLVRHQRVARCAVQVRSKGQGHQALVAYVVLHSSASTLPGAELTGPALVDEIRSFCKQTLPEYMTPSYILFLSSLPETANGKIDLKALKDPDWSAKGGGAAGGSSTAAAIVEPRNEIEAKLCAIWCTILQLGSISVNDNFFELGGTSITAARLLSAMKRELGVELNVSLLFHAPTVAGVAEKIAFLKKEGSLAEYGSASTGANANNTNDINTTSGSNASTSAASTALDGFDSKKEIVLDPSICDPRWDHRSLTPASSSTTSVTKVSPIMHHPHAIFLTGVTGFLGVHLLASLLHRTSARIYCLIRLGGSASAGSATDASVAALAKIVSNIVKFRLIDTESTKGRALIQRIIPVLGDLASMRLGISAAQWSHLSTTIDGIIHCGAFVNSVLPYSQLKSSNVGGTHEVLRLATSGGKIKSVHQISTLSVFQSSYAHKITELEPLTADGLSLTSGYPTSKFIADSLILAAARRGLPVAIYRPGRITGHSQTGLTSLDDFFTRLLKGCVQLSAFPDLDWLCDLTPVDWMAESIVHLALNTHPPLSQTQAESYGQPLQSCSIYHLHNPIQIHWMKLAEWLIQQHGYPCKIVEYQVWLKMLQDAVSDENASSKSSSILTPGNAATGIPRIPCYPNILAPLMTVFGPTRESMGTHDVMPSFNSKFTLESIVKAKYTSCPEPNQQLLHTYFTALNQQGFM